MDEFKACKTCGMVFSHLPYLLHIFVFFGLSESRICEQTVGWTKKRQNLGFFKRR
jgi:hypothetical protein